MIATALVAARVQGQHFKVDRAAQRAEQTPFFFLNDKSRSLSVSQAHDTSTSLSSRRQRGEGVFGDFITLVGNPRPAACWRSRGERW